MKRDPAVVREERTAADELRMPRRMPLALPRQREGDPEQHPLFGLSMKARLAHRCGAALGLAYQMHERGERRRDVVAQLREARAFAAAGRDQHDDIE